MPVKRTFQWLSDFFLLKLFTYLFLFVILSDTIGEIAHIHLPKTTAELYNFSPTNKAARIELLTVQ